MVLCILSSYWHSAPSYRHSVHQFAWGHPSSLLKADVDLTLALLFAHRGPLSATVMWRHAHSRLFLQAPKQQKLPQKKQIPLVWICKCQCLAMSPPHWYFSFCLTHLLLMFSCSASHPLRLCIFSLPPSLSQALNEDVQRGRKKVLGEKDWNNTRTFPFSAWKKTWRVQKRAM